MDQIVENLYQVDNASIAEVVGVDRQLVGFQLVVCRIVTQNWRGGVATLVFLWFIVTAVNVVFGAVPVVCDAIRVVWIVTLEEDQPGVNFIDILCALFLLLFRCQKISNPKHSFVIFGKNISAKKASVKC
jgi:hypothetical protein